MRLDNPDCLAAVRSLTKIQRSCAAFNQMQFASLHGCSWVIDVQLAVFDAVKGKKLCKSCERRSDFRALVFMKCQGLSPRCDHGAARRVGQSDKREELSIQDLNDCGRSIAAEDAGGVELMFGIRW
jgi:hypothetical protein